MSEKLCKNCVNFQIYGDSSGFGDCLYFPQKLKKLAFDYCGKFEDIETVAKPITPDQIPSHSALAIDAFNKAIKSSWDISTQASVVSGHEVAHELATKLGMSLEEVIKGNYLDVASIYRKAGWYVEVFESYPPKFKFSKQPDRRWQGIDFYESE